MKAIGFHDCSFKGIDSDLNIDDKVEFNIQELSFEEIVDDSLTSKNFGRIVKGIQGCGLKDSLVKVNLTRWGKDVNRIIDLTSDNLKNVSVHCETYWYFYNL